MQIDNNLSFERESKKRVMPYVTLLGVALFFPGMINTFGLALEQALTIILFGVSILLIVSMNARIKYNTFIFSFLVYFYFQCAILISLFRSSSIFITSDAVEIFKPLYLYAFFLLPFCFFKTYLDLKIISKFLILFCLILAVFGILEAWTSFGYSISTFLYKPERLVLKDKAVASFIITYTFASFMVLPFFYFLTRALSQRKIFNIDFIYSFLCIFCIFSTQSKTVFIGIILIFFLYFLLYMSYGFTYNKKRVFSFFILFLLLISFSIGVLVSFFENKFRYIYNGLDIVITSLMDNGLMSAVYSTPSIFLRFEQFQFAMEEQDIIPLIGVAIGKSVLMPESIYALYMYRVGLIGLFLHFSMLLYLILKSYECAKYFKEKEDIHFYSWFMAIHFYALSLPLSYFSSAVNDQTRTGFVFYFLIAGTIFTLRKIRVMKKC